MQYIFAYLNIYAIIRLLNSVNGDLSYTSDVITEQRHICGGHQRLLHQTYANREMPEVQINSNFIEIATTMERKTRMMNARSSRLFLRYARRRVLVPTHYGNYMGQAPCFNLYDSSSQNAVVLTGDSQILGQLQQDFESLKTVLGILTLMKDEEHEFEEGGMSQKLQKLKTSTEFLMCEIILAMETLSRRRIERIVQPVIQTWCTADDRLSRYRRDAILLYQISQFSSSLLNRYRVYKNSRRIENR